VLLVFGAPCQLRLLAGQEHGRTIPLTDIGRRSADDPNWTSSELTDGAAFDERRVLGPWLS
jgi:hypothetical protein